MRRDHRPDIRVNSSGATHHWNVSFCVLNALYWRQELNEHLVVALCQSNHREHCALCHPTKELFYERKRHFRDFDLAIHVAIIDDPAYWLEADSQPALLATVWTLSHHGVPFCNSKYVNTHGEFKTSTNNSFSLGFPQRMFQRLLARSWINETALLASESHLISFTRRTCRW